MDINETILKSLDDIKESQQYTSDTVDGIQEQLGIFQEQYTNDATETRLYRNAQDENSAKEKELEQSEKLNDGTENEVETDSETYTEVLQQINEGIQFQNQLTVVNGFIIALVLGVLTAKTFIDRLWK